MKTKRQINTLIKKQVLSEGFNDYLTIKNVVKKDTELEQENEITLTFESTCKIGVINTYKVTAIYNKDKQDVFLIYTGQPIQNNEN